VGKGGGQKFGKAVEIKSKGYRRGGVDAWDINDKKRKEERKDRRKT